MCHIKSVPKVAGVLIPIKFIYFVNKVGIQKRLHEFVSEGRNGIFEIQILAVYF